MHMYPGPKFELDRDVMPINLETYTLETWQAATDCKPCRMIKANLKKVMSEPTSIASTSVSARATATTSAPPPPD